VGLVQRHKALVGVTTTRKDFIVFIIMIRATQGYLYDQHLAVRSSGSELWRVQVMAVGHNGPASDFILSLVIGSEDHLQDHDDDDIFTANKLEASTSRSSRDGLLFKAAAMMMADLQHRSLVGCRFSSFEEWPPRAHTHVSNHRRHQF
jgi:hypothetical protein